MGQFSRFLFTELLKSDFPLDQSANKFAERERFGVAEFGDLLVFGWRQSDLPFPAGKLPTAAWATGFFRVVGHRETSRKWDGNCRKLWEFFHFVLTKLLT